MNIKRNWGLGIGDWAQSPIPNPQSPIPNPHLISEFNLNNYLIYFTFILHLKLYLFRIKIFYYFSTLNLLISPLTLFKETLIFSSILFNISLYS